ncbi:lipopolysaccharide biosynthesis protein [Xenorhabdus szentirmaii]|uniref:lipopolysaccharide biosynthesis protein n=1 Tax=Xenorhabdus szentirmaii TaxID=290112 RepID=UPI0019AE317E|nr:oligosaccharide flippase family protein [Xenorhabdus sp. CUL]MBD2792782.1 oligosaccharide flippase family protein [Xenorhabdus sp. CUL]
MKDNNYWSKVGVVFSGTLISQLIPILGSLIIVRLYAPNNIGEFATWLSIIILLSIILTARFESAFGLEEDGYERNNTLIVTLINILISSFSLMIFLLLYIFIMQPENFEYFLLIIAIPASVCYSIYTVTQSWLSCGGYFKKLGSVRISQNLLITIPQIIFGNIDPTLVNIISGYIVGSTLSCLFCLKQLPIKKDNFKDFTLSIFRDKWKKHKRFLLYSLPADTANSLSSQLPIILVNYKFGSEWAGYLSLTIKTLGAPISLLGGSIRDVFIKSASTSYRINSSCKNEYKKTFNVLMILSSIMLICSIFILEPIFSLLFGEQWRISGLIGIWLIPMFALRFVSSPLSYTLYIAEKQNIDFVWQMSLLFLTITSFTIGTTAKESIILYSIFYTFLYIIYLYISYKYSEK